MTTVKIKHQSRINLRKLYRDNSQSELNRVRKLERHVKKFPNDEQAKAALASSTRQPRHGVTKPGNRGKNTNVVLTKTVKDGNKTKVEVVETLRGVEGRAYRQMEKQGRKLRNELQYQQNKKTK